MKLKRMYRSVLFLGVCLLSATCAQAVAEPAARENGAGTCLECHKAETQTLLGEWQHLAMKSATIQLKVGEHTEIVTFAKARLKLNNTTVKGDPEKMLRSIGEGEEVAVRYVEKNGAKEASVITVKPVVKLAATEKIALADLEKLVARGPEKGKYLLVDSRPARSFAAGAIATAVSLPFSEFAGKAGMLPADKKRLLVFYGDNARSRMGTDSMKRARVLGYRNVRVLGEGMSGWLARNSGSISAAALTDAYRDVPYVLLDVRPADVAAKGSIKGATAFAGADAKALKSLPKKELKAPVIVYDGDGKGNARKVAADIVKSGQGNVLVLAGGFAAARQAGLPLESGAPNAAITYKPAPRPGAFPMDDFIGIIEAIPADTILLDVRNGEELKDGAIKGALNIPVQELFSRAAEVPRDKRVIAYCNSGARAEMAYHILKKQGFTNIFFLKAHVDYDNGKPDIY